MPRGIRAESYTVLSVEGVDGGWWMVDSGSWIEETPTIKIAAIETKSACAD